jgi:PIN domain nuclease of toxin-antitoxin system
MNISVLDSCAIIAFLYGEQGKDIVKEVLNGKIIRRKSNFI